MLIAGPLWLPRLQRGAASLGCGAGRTAEPVGGNTLPQPSTTEPTEQVVLVVNGF